MAFAVVAVAYLVGSVPFSGIIARRLKGVDLRQVGTGTVSGTGLYRVAGLRPLIVGGVLDVAKGAVGPLLAGQSRPGVAVVAGAAAVVGHNWSVFLRGAGGRGISPAMGAMLPLAPEGSVLLLVALAVGKAVDATSLGAFAGFVGLFPLLAANRPGGALLAAALVAPMLVKRVVGNRPPSGPNRARVYLVRLFFDQDSPRWPKGFWREERP